MPDQDPEKPDFSDVISGSSSTAPVGAGAAGRPGARSRRQDVFGPTRRQPLEDREEVLRQRERLEADLRGEPGPDQESRPDPARLDAEDSRVKKRRTMRRNRVSPSRPRSRWFSLPRSFRSRPPARSRRRPRRRPSPPSRPPSRSADPGAVRHGDRRVAREVARSRQEGGGAADTFKPKDTIFAVVSTDGSAAASTIHREVDVQGRTQTVKEDSKTISPTGPATTEFSIQKPSGLAEGGLPGRGDGRRRRADDEVVQGAVGATVQVRRLDRVGAGLDPAPSYLGIGRVGRFSKGQDRAPL